MRREPQPDDARRRDGSAYAVTLLCLVVLTMLALSLALVTQSEMRIGVNERVIQRVFYAADAGVAAATARALANDDYTASAVLLEEPDASWPVSSRSRVRGTVLLPILDAPCDLCEINDAGSYGERAYRRVSHALTVRAERLGGADDTVTALKTLTAMIDLLPWRDPPHAYLPVEDPDALAEIVF